MEAEAVFFSYKWDIAFIV